MAVPSGLLGMGQKRKLIVERIKVFKIGFFQKDLKHPELFKGKINKTFNQLKCVRKRRFEFEGFSG